jgi:hypothetical protein
VVAAWFTYTPPRPSPPPGGHAYTLAELAEAGDDARGRPIRVHAFLLGDSVTRDPGCTTRFLVEDDGRVMPVELAGCWDAPTNEPAGRAPREQRIELIGLLAPNGFRARGSPQVWLRE